MRICILLCLIPFFSSCQTVDMSESGNLVPRTVDMDPALPSIVIKGEKFHGETFGDLRNPIFIFIPGGPGTDYSGLISKQGIEPLSRYPNQRKPNQLNVGLNQLQKKFFCVFFDPRGAGLSPRYDKGTHSLDQYHTDLKNIIEYYIQKKFTETGLLDTSVYLGGHSFGGLYATSFINTFPNLIKDVVLFEPAPLSKEVYKALIQTSVFSMINETWLTEYLYALKHLSYDDHARADYHRILGFSKSFPELEYPDYVPLWRYGALVNAELEEKSFRDENFMITNNLANFKGKALFVWGEKTRALDANGIQLQMSYYSRYKSVTIPNAGHYMVWENPNICVEAIHNFIK